MSKHATRAKKLPDISQTGAKLIRCRNLRLKRGRMEPCNQALAYIEYGKGEAKCPHSRCKKVTAFEIVDPNAYRA